MNHHRHAIRLGALVDRCKLAIAVHIFVWGEHLVRRMQLDGTNADSSHPVHFGAGVGNGSRQDSAECNQPVSGAALQYFAIQSFASGVNPIIFGGKRS